MTAHKAIVVGRLVGAYGINGWMHLTECTDPIQNIFTYPSWYLLKNKHWQPLTLEAHRAHADGFIVKLQNISDPETALLYKGLEIGVPRESLPATEEGEYYWNDLIGCSVKTT